MNILVCVADALRADHLSCYGYERQTSPNIDQFAHENVRYESAITPSTWTRSVASSILTGTFPSVHGVQTMEDHFTSNPVRFPTELQNEGYSTIGISGIGNVSSEIGFGEGFDKFSNLYKDTSLVEDRTSSSAEKEMLEHESGDVVFPRAEDLLKQFDELLSEGDVSEPFFSLLWFIDPHDPYDPLEDHSPFINPDYDGPIDGSRESLRQASSEADFQRLINLYDSEVSYLDKQFGRLVELLKEREVWKDTLVIFVGDHGEAFGDHDQNVGHSNVHYEELIHVPWIIRYPEEQPGWKGKGELVSLIDVLPTATDYADIPVDLALPSEVSGRSVLEGGREEVFTETQYSSAQNSFYSLRQDQWKYIAIESPDRGIKPYLDLLRNPEFIKGLIKNPRYFFQRRFGQDNEHLYDLKEDPGEKANLIEEKPNVRKGFAESLEQRKQTLKDSEFEREKHSAEELDDNTRNQLKEMGYLE